MGTTALEIAGDAATRVCGRLPQRQILRTRKAQQVISDFRERYSYVTLPWHLGSAYDDVYITAECLRKTGDDQDADGFRDCLYEITWSGAIGEDYSFDENGEVVGLSRAVVEILPVAERTERNYGFKVLGPASDWTVDSN